MGGEGELRRRARGGTAGLRREEGCQSVELELKDNQNNNKKWEERERRKFAIDLPINGYCTQVKNAGSAAHNVARYPKMA